MYDINHYRHVLAQILQLLEQGRTEQAVTCLEAELMAVELYLQAKGE